MKTLMQAAALTTFAFMASTAGAVTVGGFQADTSGPTLSADGIEFIVSAGGIEDFGGVEVFSGPAGSFLGVLDTSSGTGGPESFTLLDVNGQAIGLAGTFRGSAVAGAAGGAVFTNTTGFTLSDRFGPNLFFTFSSDPLDSSGGINNGTLTIQNAAVIPLPAGIWLVIGGIGALGAVRRLAPRRQVGA